MFCGIVTDETSGKTKKLTMAIEPIKPIPVFSYRCDSHFQTDVLKEMLESSDKYGFIVIDGNGALFATVQGNAQNVLYRYSVTLPKKHRRGGQSSVRFARLRLEARQNYLTKIGEMATRFFIDPDTNKPNVSGLIIAGSAEFKDQLAGGKILDPRLQTKILDIVDVAYGFNQGLQQAIELTGETLKNVALVQQKKLISQFFSEIQQDSGKICFGVQDTLAALEAGVVDRLLVYEDLDIVRTVMKNSTGESKIIFLKENDPLPASDDNTWEVVDSMPLVDWLAENYTQFGASLEFIHDSTAEGNQFCKGFGGIGGLLRYKMELPSQDADMDDNEDEIYEEKKSADKSDSKKEIEEEESDDESQYWN